MTTRHDILSALRLIRSENVGPRTFFNLMRMYGTAERALDALPRMALRGGKKDLTLWTAAQAEDELNRLQSMGGEMITHHDPHYPAILRTIVDAPPVLSFLGQKNLLSARFNLAIVGSRNASANGCRLATSIARDMGQAGVVIVSGLARGIDAAAHEGSLTTGTIAVVAGGVDIVYPKENADLYARIKHQGLILSEDPLGTVPQARHFPKRNRLIAGLSQAVLVVEAAPQSGSLITARYALEQGRDVFAVPGSPFDPRCHGPNHLIRQGAVLVESAQDILPLFEAMKHQMTSYDIADNGMTYHPLGDVDPTDDHTEARLLLLGLLSPAPTPVDDLVRLSGVPTSIVHIILMELELAGRIERTSHTVSLCA